MATPARTASPALPPKRGLSRDEAAEHVGVGPTTFDRMVKEGAMPKPIRIGRRVLWDCWEIDQAFTALRQAGTDDADEWESAA